MACVLALAGCSGSPPAQAPSSPVAPQPQAEETTTALTVSAINSPIRLFGSDGNTHLEYSPNRSAMWWMSWQSVSRSAWSRCAGSLMPKLSRKPRPAVSST